MARRRLRARIFQIPRYPLSTTILAVALICAAAVTAIYLGLHRSGIHAAAIASAAVFCILAAIFTTLLYRGMRFDHGRIAWRWPRVEMPEGIPDVPLPREVPDVGDESILGVVLGWLLAIIAVIVLVVLVVVGVQLGIFLALLIIIPAYALFRFSARLVLAHARACQGRFARSAAVGAAYAAAYTLILTGILLGIGWLAG